MAFEVAVDPYYINVVDKEKLLHWSKSLFNSIQAGILVIDVETRVIVDINYAAALMIGSSREDIVGSSCTTYCCLCKNEKCPVIDLGMDIESGSYVLTRKDGSKLDILVSITSLILYDRKFLIESFVDVSSCKEDKEDWSEMEKLLSDNIIKTKKMYSNIDKNISEAKQKLYKALDYSGEDNDGQR